MTPNSIMLAAAPSTFSASKKPARHAARDTVVLDAQHAAARARRAATHNGANEWGPAAGEQELRDRLDPTRGRVSARGSSCARPRISRGNAMSARSPTGTGY